MQIKFYPCISPWSRGSHLLFSCQKFFVRMQDIFRISPYTGHYSFHFELKIHMASLIKWMQGWGQVIYKFSYFLLSPRRFLTWPLPCLVFDSYDFASSVYSVSNIEEVLSYLLLGYRTPPGGGGVRVLPHMAYTGMRRCRWTGYVFYLAVLKRVYNFVWVCQKGIACMIDFNCLMNFVCTPSKQKQWL